MKKVSLLQTEHRDLIDKYRRIVRHFSENSKLLRIEQSLRKSEERYRKLFERIPIGLYHTTASGKFLMANPTMISMMGFSSFEELSKVNLNDENIGPTYSRLEFYKMIEQEEEVKGFEANWIKKNGELMFVRENVGAVRDDNGKVLYYQGSAEDLTRHRANEEALSMLATIIESSPDAIIVRNLEGKIIHWNYGAENLYGYTAEEMVGKSVFLLVPKDRRIEVEKNTISVMQGHSISNYESIRVKKNGDLVNVFVSVCPIKNAQGEIVAIASNARDITEKKLYEKQREMLIAIASHELKTPITTIRAFTQVLQKHHKGRHNLKSSQYLSKMSQQIDKLTKLTRDLLDVVRIRGGKLVFRKSKVDIYKLITSIVEDIRKTTKSHKILVRGQSVKFVYADSGRICQVISNLLLNAIKYSPNSNKVIVDIKCKKDSLVVGVKDFGVGIDKKSQGDVFRSFTRLNQIDNEVFPGLGLGLFIASEIIAAHGGKIWVKSEKGKGSTFYFSFPFYNLRKISKEKEYLAQKLQMTEYTTMPVLVN